MFTCIPGFNINNMMVQFSKWGHDLYYYYLIANPLSTSKAGNARWAEIAVFCWCPVLRRDSENFRIYESDSMLWEMAISIVIVIMS